MDFISILFHYKNRTNFGVVVCMGPPVIKDTELREFGGIVIF